MKDKLFLVIAGLLIIMSVLVDFTSKFMSIGADALLIGLAAFFGWMYYKAMDNKDGKG